MKMVKRELEIDNKRNLYVLCPYDLAGSNVDYCHFHLVTPFEW